MQMTPGQVLFVSRIVDAEDDRSMDTAVIAATVGQADPKGRKKYWEARKA